MFAHPPGVVKRSGINLFVRLEHLDELGDAADALNEVVIAERVGHAHIAGRAERFARHDGYLDLVEDRRRELGRRVRHRAAQWYAQQAIARQVQATGAESGTVVVMDPRSGAVLAMATAPTYDPNDSGKARPQDMGDRPLAEIYEPGSTGKVITMSAALQEGLANPATPVTVPLVTMAVPAAPTPPPPTNATVGGEV